MAAPGPRSGALEVSGWTWAAPGSASPALSQDLARAAALRVWRTWGPPEAALRGRGTEGGGDWGAPLRALSRAARAPRPMPRTRSPLTVGAAHDVLQERVLRGHESPPAPGHGHGLGPGRASRAGLTAAARAPCAPRPDAQGGAPGPGSSAASSGRLARTRSGSPRSSSRAASGGRRNREVRPGAPPAGSTAVWGPRAPPKRRRPIGQRPPLALWEEALLRSARGWGEGRGFCVQGRVSYAGRILGAFWGAEFHVHGGCC